MKNIIRAAALSILAITAPVTGAVTAHAQPLLQHGMAMKLPVDPTPLSFEVDDEARGIEIEIARSPEEQARGLMFRTDLPELRGMLFILDRERVASFWMQNTPAPLDLLFVDADGVVTDILQGEPFSTASISPGVPSRFVLELHAGMSQRIGIVEGTRLSHPEIDAADAE